MPRTLTWQAHVASATGSRTPPPFPLLPFPSPPFLVEKGTQADAPSRIDRRRPASWVLPPPFAPHSRGRGAHEGTPLCVAPAPSRSLFAPPRSREKGARNPPTPPFSIARRREAHEGTPPPVPPFPLGRGAPLSPSPFACAAVYAREWGTQGYTTPGPTLPIRAEGGCTRARYPWHLPSPLAAPPRTRGKGHEGHPVATGPSPSPFDRAALYARERGTRGYATPGPTLPIRAEVGHRGTPLSRSTAPPCTRRKGARKDTRHATPPFPFARKGRARGARHPLPLGRAAPYARTGGTRGQAAPSRGAPFAREGVHEATRLPTCRAAGPAPSVCPRSPRLHPVFA
ncbi:hypothetical protein EDB84DRAFT_1560544 [Lactarius hengduanensis]|nr:hypothetical protein EDB84DRAFT_1560544 [Lactarius hengduanensis]